MLVIVNLYHGESFADVPLKVHLLPFADRIISLGSEGLISEVGSFHELRSTNGYVAGLNIESRTKNVPGPLLAEDRAEYRFDKQKATKANTEITRQLGDSEVYMYYFRSNGLRNYIFYFGLQIAWTTMGNFPSMYQDSMHLFMFSRQQWPC
jgi:ATP-binding cassette, subfamily C (CFTR/MRP), member 1